MKNIAALSLLLLASPAFAQIPPAPPAVRTVSVSGDAKESIAPDRAVLYISVVSENKQSAIAKKENDERVEKLVSVASKFDIPQEKINTSNISIQPKYSYEQKTGKQIFEGYMVNRSFVVTVDDISQVEKIMTAFVDAKLDQVNNVEFTLKDPKALGDKLRVAAFNDAKARAQALAEAAGAKLGKAVEITTGGSAPHYPRPMMAKAMAMEAADTGGSVAPSLPGQIEQQQSVNVVFELEY